MKPENFKLKYTRLATLNDTVAIVDLASKQVAISGYAGVPIDPKRIRVMIETSIIESPKDHLMLVSVDDKDKVVGFIACYTFVPHFSVEKTALELGWYCLPNANDYKKRMMELRAGYEEWCRRHGVRFAQYAVMNPTAEDFVEFGKHGKSKVVEMVYQRDLSEIKE